MYSEESLNCVFDWCKSHDNEHAEQVNLVPHSDTQKVIELAFSNILKITMDLASINISVFVHTLTIFFKVVQILNQHVNYTSN